ncbi:hypothetical protein NE237_016909 [Protea cynaroides]|uniref:Cation efflux protein transmembrane domain-containing protein n=1 Tax=Protea cynaroides TaxID=273540 RepID=A0A9Q0K6Z9_9MAGN|nr:hypothetical protein NE237_016909 [Protea cynaroides]
MEAYRYELRENQLNEVPLVHTDSFSHSDHSRSSYPHAHESDFHSHSASGDTGPLSKELSSETKLPQEPQMHHHHIDHNMEGIFLHVLADTMGSVGVIISTLLIKYKGRLIADPTSVQNLQVWSFTNTAVVGTLHLHVSTETDKDSTKANVAHILNDAGIKDLTIQVECVKGD